MTNRQIIRQFVSWFAPKADKLVIEIPCISWILYVLSLTYINLIAYNLIINGTNWHFLALANCYKPNRSKVSRGLSAKCHECRILSYQGYRGIIIVSYNIRKYHHFGLYFGLSKNKKSPKILFLRAFLWLVVGLPILQLSLCTAFYWYLLIH